MWLIFIVALVMGLPTIRGGFVGGDDHRLVLNHVLVNHPSLKHAIQLFGIVHRDLYQPLPLLSFQAEFALGNLFGMFDQGIEGASWFFHLNNVLLHAANAILVWFVVRMLHLGLLSKRSGNTSKENMQAVQDQHSSWTIATIAAILFAVHPMQTEVVAWLNGRMILMSTLFGLASLLTFHQWMNLKPSSTVKRRGRSMGWAIATLILVLFCMISKVRIGLPVLLGIVMLTQHRLWNRRVWTLWFFCSVVVGIFVLINVQATSEAKLFSNAEVYLQGPRIVRVLLALDHYIRHLIWPVGLASFYPTPLEVYWSDRATWIAAMVAIPVLLFWGWACIRYRLAMWSALWFWSTIAATLPVIPARNILAADRYMYLPVIGLFWLTATMLYLAYQRWIIPMHRSQLRYGLWFIGVGLVAVMIGMCWHIASFYENSLQQTKRRAQIFPNVPHVWERLGWAYHNLGRYDEALECAQKELRQDNRDARSSAYQLIGMTALNRGEVDQAIAYLQKAIETDPNNKKGKYRIACAYHELGQYEKAIIYYRQAIESAPGNNPTINLLAGLYRELHRNDEARRLYEQSLDNNPYDVTATMGLAELDINLHTPESYREALTRLESLLDWMPENIDARVNLGVVYNGLHEPDQAMAAYQSVLAIDPRHETASMNLAQLYLAGGRVQQAMDLFQGVMKGGLQPQQQAMVSVILAMMEKRYDDARLNVEKLCSFGEVGREARRYLLSALETWDGLQPGVVWTYCLSTKLLIAEGNIEAARAFIQLCERFCNEGSCKEYIQQLQQSLAHKPG